MPITEGGRFTPDNNIVSPGVFLRENDLSGIAQSVADIGAVIVAPFAKGPGFSPTLVSDMTTLQQIFGVPDGTLYGPYTAQQYLQEKGFVTVCRVGALTGYHQNYPFVIWAEKGDWIRGGDSGWTNPTASSISITGLYAVTQSIIDTATSASISGSVTFISQPVTIRLMDGNGSGVLTGSSPISITSSASIPHSGSVIYAGQLVTGFINGTFQFSQSFTTVTTASATSASIITALFAENYFVGTVDHVQFTSSTVPFNTAFFYATDHPVQVSQSLDLCGNITLDLLGLLSGSIGKYTGDFESGSNNTFNSCTGQWTTSGSAIKVLSVLADTMLGGIDTTLHAPGFSGSTQALTPSVSGSTSIGVEFNLYLSQSADGGYGVYNYSLDPSSTKYISNVFGKNPRVGDPATAVAGQKVEAAYLYRIFEDDIATVADSPSSWKVHGNAMPSGSLTGEPMNFTDQYSLDLLNGDSQFGLTNAYTPWVVSQKISPWNGGVSSRFPLFRLLTLSDGTNTNTSYKIEISNVKLAGTIVGSDWGTFTLTVRDYSDTDRKVKILEQFSNLTLDSTSPDFIARRIGDRYNFIRFDGKIIEFGTYNNNSSYIRVEMSSNPFPVTAVPYGFQAYSVPVNGSIGHWCNPMAFTKASIYGLFPGKYPSGVDFNGFPSGADTELTNLYPTSSNGIEHWRDNLQYFAPVPSGATVGGNVTFALDDETTANGVLTGSSSTLSASNAVPATFVNSTNETVYVKMRKFVFGFQGGFDGQSPAIPENIGSDITAGNTQGLNCANSTTAGSIAYKQAIGAVGNPFEFDINLIATPGIIYSLHSYVTNLVVDMCETRGDCFYILDIYKDDGNPATSQIDEVVSLASEFDTNYAATYYPWLKIKDTNINQIVMVPPSVIMPAVYAANDRVAGEWWAPAGLNRAGIPIATQVTDRTTQPERDVLYVGKVNPIAVFPGQGVAVWGQKTLQIKASAFDRINVRRLLIEIKKFFASTGRFLAFEQNTATTRNKFLAMANPFLESIQQRSGLYAFQIVFDDSTNTPDLIDRNILYGKLFLKPTKASEFIIWDFNVMATGASFPSA